MKLIKKTEKLVIIVDQSLKPGQQLSQSCHALADFAIEHREIFEAWQHGSNYLCCLSTSRSHLGNFIKSIPYKHTVFTDSYYGRPSAVCIEPLDITRHKEYYESFTLTFKNQNMKERTEVVQQEHIGKYTNQQRESYAMAIKKIKQIIAYNTEHSRLGKIISKDPKNRPEVYNDIDKINKKHVLTIVNLGDDVASNLEMDMREFYLAYARFRGRECWETRPTKIHKSGEFKGQLKKHWTPPNEKIIDKYLSLMKIWYLKG